jgi:DNA-binding response OmpR family regulator
MRVLIVEEDLKLASNLLYGLRGEGFVVDSECNAEIGLQMGLSQQYDLIVIDVRVSGDPGIMPLKRLRAQRQNVLVMALIACVDLEFKLECFEAGTDDCLVIPFALPEFIARVHALLRRGPQVNAAVVKLSDLEFDRISRQVRRAGQRIDLSPKEYSLLEYMLLNPRQVFSRSIIIDRIWDRTFEGLTNIVDVYICQLRRKIDDGFDHKLIRTVRGIGYSINIPEHPSNGIESSVSELWT